MLSASTPFVISHGGCTQKDIRGRGVACHDTELAGKAPHDGQSVVSGGVAMKMVLYISIWTKEMLCKCAKLHQQFAIST